MGFGVQTFTIRKSQTVRTTFTHSQENFYNHLLDIEREVMQICHGPNVEFMMNMIQRQCSSCIFGMIPSVEKLLNEKVGLEFDLVKTNKLSDMGTLTRSFNDDEKAIIQEYINKGYELFLKRCADGRGMSVEDIDKIGQGRVWTGSKAKELGLVDEIGDLDMAVGIAAQLAKVGEYDVVSYPAESNFMEKLLDENKEEYMEAMAHNMFGDFYRSIKFIRRICESHPVQARLPFELNMR